MRTDKVVNVSATGPRDEVQPGTEYLFVLAAKCAVLEHMMARMALMLSKEELKNFMVCLDTFIVSADEGNKSLEEHGQTTTEEFLHQLVKQGEDFKKLLETNIKRSSQEG